MSGMMKTTIGEMSNQDNNFMYCNMYLLRNGILKGNESMIRKKFSNDLRVFIHNYIPTPTSPEIRKLTGEEYVDSYFSTLKRKYKGLYLEHINEVKVLSNKYIELALDPTYELTEEGVHQMCVDDYKAVYKLSGVELLEGQEAIKYIQ